MLSVQPLKSAQGAADYYAAAFNYYAGDAQALRWLGKGAEYLGLSGVVEKEQMLQLLEGKLPNGQVLQNKKGEHRPGFDMTYSAPKSVSILIGLQADPKLEQFHDLAVERSISRIEKEFAQARVVIDGKVHYVDTGKLVTAAFRQPSSRANDPATHTHGVTMNITITDEDGKARSLASDIHGNQGVVEQLQQYVTYGGLVYRTELANLLKENNYRLEDVGKGMFEIAGFSKEVLREFSTRRVDIEEVMQENGWEGSRLASKATLLTRPSKEEHDINILRADWNARAGKLGFDAHQFVKNHKEETVKPEAPGFLESLKSKIFSLFYEKKDLIALEAKEAVFVAIESIAQKESVFSVRDLKEAALRHTLTGKTVVPIHAIEQCIEHHIDNQTLYAATDPLTQRDMLTTPWALTLETETLSRINTNQGVVKPIASNAAVTRLINDFEAHSKYGLTPSQKNALLHTFTSSDRFQAIQGYAGTGKTTMLQLTKQLAEEKGFELRGIAVTSSAVNELRNKAGINADVFPIVHQELLHAKKNSLQNTIFILDEASMLSTVQGHELIKLIEQKGGRNILVGDDAQLSSVKCGRIFGQAQEYGIQTSKLTDIIRQTNDNAKASVQHSIERELHDSIQKIHEVKEFKTHEERISAVAHRWLSLSQSVRDRTLVFAPTHANRQKITDIIRKGLKKEGILIGNEIHLNTLKSKALEEVEFHHTQYYQEGDVLRFNLNVPKSKIKSGDYLTVGAITEKHRNNNQIPLVNADGKQTLFRLNDLPKYNSSRAGLNRTIECYEQQELALCINDKLLITRNNRQSGLVNSELAFVKTIDEQHITLGFENDGREKIIPLDAPELKHLDHGYVLTNMKVQGKDKTYAIGLIESYNKFSATLRNYYVQISRAVVNMTLITDDKTRLTKALELNDDTKKTALDYVSGKQVEQHEQRFEHHPNSISIEEIKNQKLHFERLRNNEQTILNQYPIFKKEDKKHLCSKLSWEICTNPGLKKLARVHLGVSESTLKNEALKVQTIRLLKELNQEEQAKLRTVKSYLSLSTRASKEWKSISHNTNNALQKKIYFDTATKRNELAFQIVERIEEYKPYLEHFSIGKTNRLGLSQYRIEKEDEYAIKQLEKLGKHAEKHHVVAALRHFFKEQHLENKESLAVMLKEQSKKIHPHLIRLSNELNKPLATLWSEINRYAKNYEEKQFCTHLSIQEKVFFNLIKEYKSLNHELATHFSSKLYCLEKGIEIPKNLEEQQIKTVQLRNQIAEKIQTGSHTTKVLDFFKLDEEKLLKQANTHNKRETVLSFKDSLSNFNERKEAALKIAGDIKGFYPLIKEFGVNTKRLNAFIRVEERKSFINELSDAQKVNYLKLLEYKSASRKAGSAWNSLFQDKEQGKSISQQRLEHVQKLTAKRNSLAYMLHDKNELHAFFEREKIDVTKIKAHSKQHKSRLEHVRQMNVSKENLLNQLKHRVPQMNQFEARSWHKSWNEFSRQVKRITNQFSLYEQVITSKKNNPLTVTEEQKALLNKYELSHVVTQNNRVNPIPNKTNNRVNTLNEFLDAKTINDSLLAKPEETYRAIFGEPKKITSREMRYSGGLVISLKGSKSGFWYDFSEGTGGNPLQAIMRERGMDFQEALKEGASISGDYSFNNSNVIRQLKSEKTQLNKNEEKNKIRSAQSIVKGGVPIKNTLAERYLNEHRGIENPERLNVLFWPKGAVWKGIDDNGNLYERINKIPALLIPAYNEKNEITGVQRIYLDPKTGKKNTFMETAKLSQGKIENSAGILQKSEKLGTLYIAEGPETGASIAMANPNSTVLVSLGLSNLKNLSSLIKRFHPKEVIIAGDNDTLSKNKALNITHEAQNNYKENGINTRIIIPKSLPGMDKTDWNDVHKSYGLSAIKEQLGIVNKDLKIHELSKNFHQEKSTIKENYAAIYDRSMTQSNKVNTILNRMEQQKSYSTYSTIENNIKIKSSEISPPSPQVKRNQKAKDLEL
ncbi:MobF family relaxase [uncultured Legionella sp.]|mgnify:CR=1 FL=1|uniref:MobF family relaxase n=1 Tax=uncultured Legionella sp. TaxID=210934 RepID=UPI00260F81BE|nr:MobF family relaxase [uncultured Legionella sp.]